MGHNDVMQVRPMKNGVWSHSSPMSHTGRTRTGGILALYTHCALVLN